MQPKISLIFILHGTQSQVNDCLNFYDIINYPKDKLKLCILATKEYDLSRYKDKIHILMINDNPDSLYLNIPNYSFDSDYTFVVDNVAIIINPETLNILLAANKQWITPMMNREGLLWADYWGAISETGFYERSDNYLDILNRTEKSIFEVPYVNSSYLFNNNIYKNNFDIFVPITDFCMDMSICANLRNKKIPINVINTERFGFLLDIGSVSLGDVNNEELNRQWEDKYLHLSFRRWLRGFDYTDLEYIELCGDAFQTPLFTPEFCQDLISSAESYNLWSGGKNSDNHYDPRLNAYENVPTQDIHLNQINLGDQWLFIVNKYVSKIASRLYSYYKTHGPNISFIVKYTPEGQPDLMPHHDASVYTINVALNQYGKDYEGGGCKFIRQDYIVKGNPPGYCLIHPGRLTHYHEGLPTTAGTRYILVSFIN